MSQKITYAHIENFKGIQNIEIQDLSRFVVIFWNNWAWKTPFLEAIKNAIKLEKWGNKKVRIGEQEWLIEIHFEDFKIKRIIGEKGKLEVEHNGAQCFLETVYKTGYESITIEDWVIGK